MNVEGFILDIVRNVVPKKWIKIEEIRVIHLSSPVNPFSIEGETP